ENYNTARDLILKGVELGATSMILAEDSLEKKQLHKVLDLGFWPGFENASKTTHMTYGTPLNQDLQKLYCLRNVSFG
ncbi:MAG: hypothetical protein ACXAB7_10480, partial [Candidatus Kariarchaeaceae archaeon]